MTWWKEKAWPGIKKWGGAFFGVIAALLLLFIGGGWLWRTQKARIGKLKDELAVSQATTNIAALRAEREALGEHSDEKTKRMKEIDEELVKNQRQIVEAHEGGEGLSDEEMLAEFARLGI